MYDGIQELNNFLTSMEKIVTKEQSILVLDIALSATPA